jgi:hypothetical protein
MELLFSPAELLMNRLSYPIKFGVLGCWSSLPSPA